MSSKQFYKQLITGTIGTAKASGAGQIQEERGNSREVGGRGAG